jgi:hypothetical protein
MILGLPARANRALEALQINEWLILQAGYATVFRKARFAFEKPSGEEVKVEFEYPEMKDSEIEEWIERQLISQLSEIACSAGRDVAPYR